MLIVLTLGTLLLGILCHFVPLCSAHVVGTAHTGEALLHCVDQATLSLSPVSQSLHITFICFSHICSLHKAKAGLAYHANCTVHTSRNLQQVIR